jgi:hypothetical protein
VLRIGQQPVSNGEGEICDDAACAPRRCCVQLHIDATAYRLRHALHKRLTCPVRCLRSQPGCDSSCHVQKDVLLSGGRSLLRHLHLYNPGHTQHSNLHCSTRGHGVQAHLYRMQRVCCAAAALTAMASPDELFKNARPTPCHEHGAKSKRHALAIENLKDAAWGRTRGATQPATAAFSWENETFGMKRAG